ncbi:MAG: elongation factor G, partial [Bacilli bacterium]|nr:elongation factor G [Bacilli bacterium]
MEFDATHIRNIAVLGHQGCGKSSLVESMAFVTGLIPEKGSVDKKTSLSDYTPIEQKRGGSAQTAVIPLVFKEHKLNLIDLPGNDDFISETIGVTGVIKGA